MCVERVVCVCMRVFVCAGDSSTSGDGIWYDIVIMIYGLQSVQCVHFLSLSLVGVVVVAVAVATRSVGGDYLFSPSPIIVCSLINRSHCRLR